MNVQHFLVGSNAYHEVIVHWKGIHPALSQHRDHPTLGAHQTIAVCEGGREGGGRERREGGREGGKKDQIHAKSEFPLFIRWYRDICLALNCLIRPTTTELSR